MARELYQIEEDEDGKYIHYNGYLWCRDNDAGEVDEATGEPLDYACTEGSWCIAYLSEIAAADWLQEINGTITDYVVAELFSEVSQYQYDMGKTEFDKCMEEWGSYPYLHMDDVTEDTPCGTYYYDTDSF